MTLTANRLILLLLTFFASLACMFGSSTVHAQNDIFDKACDTSLEKKSTLCKDKDPSQSNSRNSIYGRDGIITKIANILATVVGIAAVVVIVIAGIQYMLSTGDSAKVNNAKNAILYALVGLVVVVVARTIVVFIIDRLNT